MLQSSKCMYTFLRKMNKSIFLQKPPGKKTMTQGFYFLTFLKIYSLHESTKKEVQLLISFFLFLLYFRGHYYIK